MQDISTFAWLLEFICCYLRLLEGTLCNMPFAFGSQFKISPPATTIFLLLARCRVNVATDGNLHRRRPADSLKMTCESSGSEQTASLTPVNEWHFCYHFATVFGQVCVSVGSCLLSVNVVTRRDLPSVVSRNVSVENRQQHYYVITWHLHKVKNW